MPATSASTPLASGQGSGRRTSRRSRSPTPRGASLIAANADALKRKEALLELQELREKKRRQVQERQHQQQQQQQQQQQTSAVDGGTEGEGSREDEGGEPAPGDRGGSVTSPRLGCVPGRGTGLTVLDGARTGAVRLGHRATGAREVGRPLHSVAEEALEQPLDEDADLKKVMLRLVEEARQQRNVQFTILAEQKSAYKQRTTLINSIQELIKSAKLKKCLKDLVAIKGPWVGPRTVDQHIQSSMFPSLDSEHHQNRLQACLQKATTVMRDTIRKPQVRKMKDAILEHYSDADHPPFTRGPNNKWVFDCVAATALLKDGLYRTGHAQVADPNMEEADDDEVEGLPALNPDPYGFEAFRGALLQCWKVTNADVRAVTELTSLQVAIGEHLVVSMLGAGPDFEVPRKSNDKRAWTKELKELVGAVRKDPARRSIMLRPKDRNTQEEDEEGDEDEDEDDDDGNL